MNQVKAINFPVGTKYQVVTEGLNQLVLGQFDAEQDARLFASAPDLLKALKNIIAYWDGSKYPNWADVFIGARKAIVQVGGKEKTG